MNQITLIMAYYENPGQLKRQYDLLRTMPDQVKENLHLIVVDDCSEENPATKGKPGFPATVFRMGPPKIAWNQDAARNIGANEATTEWLLLTDIDHMVPRETWDVLVNKEFNRDTIYKFSRVSAPTYDPYKPHPNSWFMTKAMYQKVGGYDERFALFARDNGMKDGVYGTDGDFRDRCAEHGRIELRPEVLVRVGREVVPDASTKPDKFLRKTQEGGEAIRRVKLDRQAIPGWRPLTLQFPYERV